VTLAPALIAFFGVLLGALITTGSNLFLAARKERSDAEKERRAQAAELKTVARVLDQEFAYAQAVLQTALKSQRWPEFEPITLRAWHNDKGILARAVSAEDWMRLCRAAETARNIAAIMDRGANTLSRAAPDDVASLSVEGLAGPNDSQGAFAFFLETLSEGRAALNSYTRDEDERS
jgi:hypothetical protein